MILLYVYLPAQDVGSVLILFSRNTEIIIPSVMCHDMLQNNQFCRQHMRSRSDYPFEAHEFTPHFTVGLVLLYLSFSVCVVLCRTMFVLFLISILAVFTIVWSWPFVHCMILSFWPLYGLGLLSIVWSCHFVHCMVLSFWPLHGLVLLTITWSCPCNHRMVLSFWPLYDLVILSIVWSCPFDHCMILSFWPLYGLVILTIVWFCPFDHYMVLSFCPLYGLVLLTITWSCPFDHYMVLSL
jgi:hypothetical protein